jgi:hypothetical protein
MVLKLEPKDFAYIDDKIRKVLVEEYIYLQPSNKQRLYLKREKELMSIEFYRKRCFFS